MDFLSSIWDVLFYFFWAFVFITALMTVFTVILDLIRDHKLSGWAKAAWIVLLVLLPWITTLVYLIARGKGMAERQNGESIKARKAADEYIRSVAGTGPASEIAQAKALLDSGAITNEEFAHLKKRVLAGDHPTETGAAHAV